MNNETSPYLNINHFILRQLITTYSELETQASLPHFGILRKGRRPTGIFPKPNYQMNAIKALVISCLIFTYFYPNVFLIKLAVCRNS